jgi:hypothetical protein
MPLFFSLKPKEIKAMPYELCRHTKADGTPCNAACMTDSFWCYFHARMHSRHRALRETKAPQKRSPLQIPVIEDRESVQLAASLIVGALVAGHLEEKRAAVILKALQLASRNLPGSADSAQRPGSVTRTTPTLDGLDLAPRRMSDNSEPPPYPPREIVEPVATS